MSHRHEILSNKLQDKCNILKTLKQLNCQNLMNYTEKGHNLFTKKHSIEIECSNRLSFFNNRLNV